MTLSNLLFICSIQGRQFARGSRQEKQWRNRLNLFPKKVLIEELKLNIKDLIYALTQMSLIGKLSRLEIIKIISSHPSFVERIVENDEILLMLSPEELAYLGRDDFNMAKKILENMALRDKFTPIFFAILGQKKLGIVNEIVKRNLFNFEYSQNRKLRPKLSPSSFKLLIKQCKHDVDIAKLMFKIYARYMIRTQKETFELYLDEETRKTIKKQPLTLEKVFAELSEIENAQFDIPKLAKRIFALAKSHVEAIRYVMRSPYFSEKMHSIHLAKFGQIHPEIAHEILNDPVLNRKLGGLDLSIMGSCDLSVAKRIIQEPFSGKLSRKSVLILSEKLPIIAEMVLQSPPWKKKKGSYHHHSIINHFNRKISRFNWKGSQK